MVVATPFLIAGDGLVEVKTCPPITIGIRNVENGSESKLKARLISRSISAYMYELSTQYMEYLDGVEDLKPLIACRYRPRNF